MKVLISGAGVAGLTVAYWLKHYGFTPTIVERAPKLPIGGYKIDVRGTALQVLHRMNIYNSILDASTDVQTALIIDKQGKVINKMTGDAFGHRVGDDVEIIRGRLCQILMDQIPDVEFIFGDSIQEVTQLPDGLDIKFQHDKARKFDLLIGADGLHSNVRRLVFGDESSFAHNLGLYLCVFGVPNYLNLDRVEMQYSELGRIVALWSVRGETNMKACFGFTPPDTAVDLHNRTSQEEIVKRTYQDVGWEVPKLLEMMPDASDFYFDASTQIYMDHWSKDRVVLVGDAAYCASPMSGQGTSIALIGAYVLAGELAKAKGRYQTAFDQYEKKMRPFIKVNQQLGITSAKVMRSQEKSNLFTWLLGYLIRLAPGSLVKFIVNLSTKRIKQAANAITLDNY